MHPVDQTIVNALFRSKKPKPAAESPEKAPWETAVAKTPPNDWGVPVFLVGALFVFGLFFT